MPKVTFVNYDKSSQVLDVPAGSNLMQVSLDNGIDAIIAECGGACSCATCHVYIDDAWLAKVKTAETIETDMIESVLDPRPNSRLSCQVTVEESLDGLVVHLPEKQY